MRFLARLSNFVLVFVSELLKGDMTSGQMIKTYGIQPNNIGKSPRVRNDA
jgi:hypothetical protein